MGEFSLWEAQFLNGRIFFRVLITISELKETEIIEVEETKPQEKKEVKKNRTVKVPRFGQKFEFVTRLGSGAEGLVVLAHNKEDGRFYAIKKIECSGLKKLSEVENLVKRGLKLGRHSNLVNQVDYYVQNSRTKDVFYYEKLQVSRGSGKIAKSMKEMIENEIEYQVCIIMEFCNAKSLQYYLQKPDGTTGDEQLVLDWVIQMFQGLEFLHSHEVLHRDLKPDNIFFHDKTLKPMKTFGFIGNSYKEMEITSQWSEKCHKNFSLKIGDFGLVKFLQSVQAKTRVGTIDYMAPEVLHEDGQGYDTPSDIWSMGAIITLLLISLKHQKKNWEARKNTFAKLRGRLLKNFHENLALRVRLYKEFSEKVSHKLSVLMYECLQMNMEQRPTATEALIFLKSKKKFLRDDPLKSYINETFAKRESLTSELLAISEALGVGGVKKNAKRVLSNDRAHAFWTSNFGEGTESTQWRKFSGAYQVKFRRIPVEAMRGLRKLLCGSHENNIVVWHVDRVVEIFGFPFNHHHLLKTERYIVPFYDVLEGNTSNLAKKKDGNMSSNVSNSPKIIINGDIDEFKEVNHVYVAKGRKLYSAMVMNHDHLIRDKRVDRWFDISQEAIALLPLENFLKSTALRVVIHGPPFCGKTTFVKMLKYHMVKNGSKIVPLYVDLNQISTNYDKSKSFIIQVMRHDPFGHFRQEIEHFIINSYTNKNILLIFDGLEGVEGGSTYSLIINEIKKISKLFKDSMGGIIIVTRKLTNEFNSFKKVQFPHLCEKIQIELSRRLLKFDKNDNKDDQILLNFSKNIIHRHRFSLCRIPIFFNKTLSFFNRSVGSLTAYSKIQDKDNYLYNVSIKKKILNHSNVHSYSTQILKEFIERVVRILENSNDLEYKKGQTIIFLSKTALYQMKKREVLFNENIFTKVQDLKSEEQSFQELKVLIHNGALDFIKYNVNERAYKFTFPFFQYFLPVYYLQKILSIENLQYERQKRKSLKLKIFRKLNLDFVEKFNYFLIDPWWRSTVIHLFLQMKQLEFKNFIKSFCRCQKIRTFVKYFLSFFWMYKRNSKKNDDIIYKMLIPFFHKRESLRRDHFELFYGLANPNIYVRKFSRKLFNFLRKRDWLKENLLYIFIQHRIDFNPDILGYSLDKTLNLAQKKSLLCKLIIWSKPGLKRKRIMLLRYMKMLKYFKTYDKNLNNEILKILQSYVPKSIHVRTRSNGMKIKRRTLSSVSVLNMNGNVKEFIKERKIEVEKIQIVIDAAVIFLKVHNVFDGIPQEYLLYNPEKIKKDKIGDVEILKKMLGEIRRGGDVLDVSEEKNVERKEQKKNAKNFLRGYLEKRRRMVDVRNIVDLEKIVKSYETFYEERKKMKKKFSAEKKKNVTEKKKVEIKFHNRSNSSTINNNKKKEEIVIISRRSLEPRREPNLQETKAKTNELEFLLKSRKIHSYFLEIRLSGSNKIIIEGVNYFLKNFNFSQLLPKERVKITTFIRVTLESAILDEEVNIVVYKLMLQVLGSKLSYDKNDQDNVVDEKIMRLFFEELSKGRSMRIKRLCGKIVSVFLQKIFDHAKRNEVNKEYFNITNFIFKGLFDLFLSGYREVKEICFWLLMEIIMTAQYIDFRTSISNAQIEMLVKKKNFQTDYLILAMQMRDDF